MFICMRDLRIKIEIVSTSYSPLVFRCITAMVPDHLSDRLELYLHTDRIPMLSIYLNGEGDVEIICLS